ncbi:MAG: class I SAM-dependent methyltransferase [Alphaproteobacteria bacterium]|jgi:cyclopropane-fatty-acyl-phospholipid synthase|nr:class I SAM-dependent methyltransferase [Alphaproteobacteria bacterium]
MTSKLITSIRIKALKKLFKQLEFGELQVTYPDGDVIYYTGRCKGPSADLILSSPVGIKKLLHNGEIGFCEAYMAGEIESNKIAALIELSSQHSDFLNDNLAQGFIKKMMMKLVHLTNKNSRSGSRKNISYHYDLGNSFYKEWLDSSMTYSSAIFDSEKQTLKDAQQNKYKKIAELAGIKSGDSVLEIGCGWGGFMEFAAQEYDAHITGITISNAQYEFTKQRIADQGLTDKTDLKFLDYRDLNQKFDKIISIEMFEAVGEQYWPIYFDKIGTSLNDGGRAALQMITISDDQFPRYRSNPDFIQRYIFPGGMLPCLSALESPIGEAGLQMNECYGFGLDYAKTLLKWRDRFIKAWPKLAIDKNFDARFFKMWELYLAYCEGGFRAGNIDVKQIMLSHKN